MRLSFWMSPNPRQVRCRRGKHTYRLQDIPPNTNQTEYPALAVSVVELLEDGKVVGTCDINNNYRQPRTVIPTKDHLDAELNRHTPETSVDRSAPADNDDVQPVGDAGSSDGPTVSGSDELPVSPVDAGDARLGLTGERGPEGGTDGVHSDPVESDTVHDRRETGVSSVPSSDEDA